MAGFRLKVWRSRLPLSLSFRCGYPTILGPPVPHGKKGGDESDPSQNRGSCGPDSGTEWHTAIRPHEGSLSSSFIPAGRLRTAPRRGR